MIEFWAKVLFLALAFDLILGEPPPLFHPVVWMGKLINLFVKAAPHGSRKLYGLLMVISCAGITVFIAELVELTGTGITGLIINAYFLKSSFSIRMLLTSALGIQRELDKGNLEKVRSDLKTFVGRETSGLGTHQSASAVIESLAESFVDGIMSPLFYFLIFGLPGALTYRMINTLDSMVGYKKEPFIELGYAAAKLDDLANLIPARVAPAIIVAASIFSAKPIDALKTCISDHNRTASPNSGWPMSAVAGALNVKLEKVNYHIIGSTYDLPYPPQIRNAVNLVGFSSILMIAAIFLIGVSVFHL